MPQPFLTPRVAPPYLGAAYYPEDWPLTQVDEDIALMKQAGLNCVRVGEFAWSSFEPREGEYQFVWLHAVIEKLGKAGIAVVLGTPTPTPPAWLAEKHPEILFVREDGSRVSHGGRRHIDPCSEIYIDYCRKIVTQMAAEFGQDPRVIGWQIDNELFPHNFPEWQTFPPSFSESSLKKFHAFLKARYGTIDALNKAWCNSLWSMDYTSFEQIPFPDKRVWHHPSFKTAWREFVEQAYIDFSNVQAEILHAKTWQPVGTDMMMFFSLDFARMNAQLDVVQFNHYHYHQGLRDAPFWLDMMNPIKERPFWNTELSTCWSGSVVTTGYSEKGYCRANTWLPIACGAELVSYWLWRQHWAGQELTHGCVVQSTGRPMHIFGEVQEIAQGFQSAAEFLNTTRPTPTGLGIHYSTLAYHTFREQWLVNGFDYTEFLKKRIYHPLIRTHWRPSILSPQMDLTGVKVLMTPFLPCLDEDGLRERIKRWIEAGGTWIAGPFTDIRDRHGAQFRKSPFGTLEEWAGVYCRYQIPSDPRNFNIRYQDGTESQGSLWNDGFELRGAESLAEYTEYPLEGLSAITRKKLGKGEIILLGTLPKPEDLLRLLAQIAIPLGITPVTQGSDNLLVVPRSGGGRNGLIVVEMENKPAWFVLEHPAQAYVPRNGSQAPHHVPPGRIEVGNYGVMVLESPHA